MYELGVDLNLLEKKEHPEYVLLDGSWSSIDEPLYSSDTSTELSAEKRVKSIMNKFSVSCSFIYNVTLLMLLCSCFIY